MPPDDPPGDRTTTAPPAKTATQPVGWPRILLLLVLLNAPLFFNGCQSQELRFTVGAVVPFVEFQSQEILWWSWPLLLVNGLAIFAALWLATRHIPWMNRIAASRWFVGTLIAIALLFNSWLVLPPLWANTVLAPQMQIAGLIVRICEGPDGVSEEAVRWSWLISARLYYLTCVVVVSGSVMGVRAFLNRYFFVRAGPRWQIQLGGLIIVMLVLGAAIGMTVRLFSSP